MNYKKHVRFCYSRTLMTHVTITYKKMSDSLLQAFIDDAHHHHLQKKTCLILCHMRLLMTHIVITYTQKKYNSLLQALCHMEVRSLFSISHYRATWWSVHRFLPVTTVPHATSHYRATWWSDHRAFHQSTQDHMMVRSSCIPPVTTVPHDDQIIMHSTSNNSIT